ncbi:MAG: phosphoserine phosphatase SerB [Rhodobacteraceae bacterium]|nr:phosphoserine phosphatase SerB [Paracoccaceae bacterium]
MSKFIVVLIAGQDAVLPHDFINDMYTRSDGVGNWDWLDEDRAAEFATWKPPDGMEQSRSEAHAIGCDLAVVPAENRQKRVLIADMDSTIIEQESIDELADLAGFGAHVATITERAMNGEISFDEALRARVALLRGQPVSILTKVWRERISITKGAAPLLKTMAARGTKSALISGGFTDFTARVAKKLEFDRHYANELLVSDDQNLTGTVREPILGPDAKFNLFRTFLSEEEVAAKDALVVGDGANDIPMLKAAGMGVAFRAKPVVNAQIDLQIRHADLTALLYLQGHRLADAVD